jgi:hypothetical protein
MENCMVVTQKIKNSITMGSNSSTTGYISKGNEISMLKRHLYFHVYHNTIHKSQEMESTEISISGWINEVDLNMCKLNEWRNVRRVSTENMHLG